MEPDGIISTLFTEEFPKAYGDTPDPMGFYAPKNSFGLTLQEATSSAAHKNS